MKLISTVAIAALLGACAPGGLHFDRDQAAAQAQGEVVMAQLEALGHTFPATPAIVFGQTSRLTAVAETVCDDGTATIVVSESAALTDGLLAHELLHAAGCMNGTMSASDHDEHQRIASAYNDWNVTYQ